MNSMNNPDLPDYVFGDLQLEWLMTRWEKYALNSLLEWIKPTISLEIGTYRGGSLQVISKHSKRVISVDLLDEPKQKLSRMFSNVDFRVGDSTSLVPRLIEELQGQDDPLNFVLIDGDHSTEGVRRDIESVLKYRPKAPMFIVMHDSFNPPCREGMLQANWASSPYVHYVELDFVPGVYFREGFGTVRPGSMYGGFGLAKFEPNPRSGELVVGQGHLGLYEATYRDSPLYQTADESGKRSNERTTWGQIKRCLRPRTRLRKLFGR